MNKDGCESIEIGMPYERSINRVVIGIALSLISLNISFLGDIISVVGMILCLLGFRILKYENKWFQSCYVITVIRAIYLILNIILSTTIIQSIITSSPIMSVINIMNLILSSVFLVCFCCGIKALQQKIEMPVVFATFSMPNDVVKQRGYLCYSVRKNNKDYAVIDSFMNYTHQQTWMQYPVKTAMETRINDGFNKSGAFLTIQDDVQFEID